MEATISVMGEDSRAEILSMDANSSFKGDGIFDEKKMDIIVGEDGQIKSWVFPHFLSFLSTKSYKGDGITKETIKDFLLGEDEEAKKWVFSQFLLFLPTFKTSLHVGADGEVTFLEMEKEKTRQSCPSSEMEMKLKASAPLSPGMVKDDGQPSIQEGEGENKITLSNRELMDNKDSKMDRAKAKGKHVFLTGNELKLCNVVNNGALQGEGSSMEEDKVHGPTGKGIADNPLLSVSKGETASHGPMDKGSCFMDIQESTTRWAKEFSKGSSEDASHIPQNVIKVARFFQQILEDSKAAPHASQVTQNGGNSTTSHNKGQTKWVDNGMGIDHVILNRNFKSLSDFFQQSSKEQNSGDGTTPKVDVHGMETCTPNKEQVTFSFADALKYGHNSKCSPLSSMHSGEKDYNALSVSKALQQNKVISLCSQANDDSPWFKVEPDVLEKRLALCKFSIVGRLSLGKGERPWTQKNLKEKLQEVWCLKSAWKLISLGRGFFHILLNSQVEWDKVWSRGPLHLKPGVMRFQRWKINFDPEKEKSSFAQVWLRIYHLPWALWDPSIIAGIARKVGEPLKFDKVTIDGEFGHYARILVDVDLSKPIKPFVHIECGKFMFEVKLVPENLPAFCQGCFSIGHSSNDCRNFLKRNETAVTSKNFGGDARVSNSVVSLGTSKELSAGNSTSSSKNPTVIKMAQNPKDKHLQTEWRKKEASGKENALKGKDTEMGIVELITDFSAQAGSHFSSDALSSYVAVSNQFEALAREDDVEDKTKVDNKSNQHVEDSVMPLRWSDILDEEDEKEASQKPQEKRTHGRDISEIRQGIQEMTQEYAHLLHTSTPNKKKKKPKAGIKQSKEPTET